MPVDTPSDVRLPCGSGHTLEGYLEAFEELRDQLPSSLGENASEVAPELCRLSRFLVFAALRQGVSEQKQVGLCKVMEEAVQLLSDAWERSGNEEVKMHRDHIAARLHRFSRIGTKEEAAPPSPTARAGSF